MQFVDSVVSDLSNPIDADFARSLIADTSTDDLAPEFVEVLVKDLLKVTVVAIAAGARDEAGTSA